VDRLSELNLACDQRALELVTPLVERAPKLAKKVAAARPFGTVDGLVIAIRREIHRLGDAERVALFRAHPELAPGDPHEMTSESQTEQGRLNLTSAGNIYRERLAELNALYRDKFGFPFITALVRHRDMDSVLAEFATRLRRDRVDEIETALDEIATVSAARVRARFCGGDLGWTSRAQETG